MKESKETKELKRLKGVYIESLQMFRYYHHNPETSPLYLSPWNRNRFIKRYLVDKEHKAEEELIEIIKKPNFSKWDLYKFRLLNPLVGFGIIGRKRIGGLINEFIQALSELPSKTEETATLTISNGLTEVSKKTGDGKKKVKEEMQESKPKKMIHKLNDVLDHWISENQDDKKGLEIAKVLKDSLKYPERWTDKNNVVHIKFLIRFIPDINGYIPKTLVKSIEEVAESYDNKRESNGYGIISQEEVLPLVSSSTLAQVSEKTANDSKTPIPEPENEELKVWAETNPKVLRQHGLHKYSTMKMYHAKKVTQNSAFMSTTLARSEQEAREKFEGNFKDERKVRIGKSRITTGTASKPVATSPLRKS